MNECVRCIGLPCCEHASTPTCRTACGSALSSLSTDVQIVEELSQHCGVPDPSVCIYILHFYLTVRFCIANLYLFLSIYDCLINYRTCAHHSIVTCVQLAVTSPVADLAVLIV